MLTTTIPEIPQAIETDRLLIRCPQPGDGAAFYELISQSRNHLLPWLSWASGSDLTPERAEASVLRNRERYLNRHYRK